MKKCCTKCKQSLPVSLFNKEKRNRDGLTSACKECISSSKKLYYQNNKSFVKEKRMIYYELNKDKSHQYTYDRKKNDPAFRAACNARNTIFKIIKGDKQYSTSLGCSHSVFKKHIESNFKPGMSWNNYGEWEVDHIFPLSKAYKLSLEQFKRACHYTNLQPMWMRENRTKGAKICLE